MTRNLTKLLTTTALVFALTLPLQAANDETFKQLELFGDVFERVRADYVDVVKDDALIENAINGMLSQLDPHSNYMNEKAYRDMQVQTRGEFGGIGAEVTMEEGFVKIVSPIDETPAARAGLKPGDLITHLDGETVQGLTLAQAVDKMRGRVNSEVKLTIRREGFDPFDVSLTRAVVRIQSVRSRIEANDIGYIRITTFNEQTDNGLKAALESIKKQLGDKVAGYIIDLRNNPGGLLDQSIKVVDDFIERGEIVSTRGRNVDEASRANATPGDLTNGKPIVVLINEGSASASEIVAGALQDHQRAVIMGTRSFGKGSVQTIIPIQGHGAMRLTTARYFTPSGRSIQQLGIVPDILVEQLATNTADGRQRLREADLRNALANPQGQTAPAQPADPAGPAAPAAPAVAQAAPATPPTDFQLARAIDQLHELATTGRRN
ncbi:MAG: S41 family peptidase [Alphaproteobacteria bacterium]|nr:S41 family peptidase [Alphaproteobacteria bacterium]